MKNPSKQEMGEVKKAADLAIRHNTITPRIVSADDEQRLKKTKHARNIESMTTAELWEGWCCRGDALIDSAGNKYGQNEIRALFYMKQEIQGLRMKVKKMTPPVVIEPEQLEFAFMEEKPKTYWARVERL